MLNTVSRNKINEIKNHVQENRIKRNRILKQGERERECVCVREVVNLV